ncbi:hypothetical protein K502DRAFT_357272, partial [Neoconidiobolus thromboides FSU 785]
GCSYSELDISTCKIKPPTPPACPKPEETKLKCTSTPASDSTFYNPGKNVCWSSNKDNSYNCQPAGADGKCLKNEVDVSTCKKLPPPPTCPPETSYYLECDAGAGNIGYAGKPGDNVCWILNGDKWSCKPKGKDGCSYSEMDITKCPFNTPKPPACPPMDNGDLKCTTKSGSTSTFDNFSPNTCWSLNKDNTWACQPYGKDGSCRLDEVDVSKCEHNKCVPIDAKCSTYGGSIGITDPNAPACWIKGKLGVYKCVDKNYSGKCNTGYTDITECYPRCPPSTATSNTSGKSVSVQAPDAKFPCWTAEPKGQDMTFKSAGYNSKGKCPLYYADVTKCNYTYDVDDADF